MNKRKYGQLLEKIALDHYLDAGYRLVDQNYTIRGGEIDLIVENDALRVYVEVKGVDHIDNLHDYVTKKKLYHVTRTMQHHLLECPTEKLYQIDVVFVQQNRILEIYENVSLFL